MKEITNAAVVGAGTMGHGIAFVLAREGIDVCLIDHADQALKHAANEIEDLLHASVQKQTITLGESERIKGRIKMSSDLNQMAGRHLLIEAVSEDLELKRQIFLAADRLIDPRGLLATNTSSLSVASICEPMANQDRMLGLHFFNPPHIMKLLEIVAHPKTSSSSIESARHLGQLLRKECILVNDSPGFATSRLGISFALEAIRMLETRVAGVTELDGAMKLGYGHPMGPLMLTDWVGLDVRLAISEHLFRTLESRVFAPPNLLRRMVRAGMLGRKSGTGFYEWDKGRSLGVSPVFMDLLNG
jgi:3-hydroxybutyryl-CoA dehydrogenase